MKPNYVDSEETLESYKKAGKLASQALHYGASLIIPDAKVVDILDSIEEFILKKKEEDPLYGIAFPPQISINDVAAHFCPEEDGETIIQKDDVVKLDVGAHHNGFIGDNALTINPSKKYQELVDAARNALESAIKIAGPGVPLSKAGLAIEKEASKKGFQPVRNLSGHGVGQYLIHTKPSVPNFDTKDESIVFEENHVYAIEPFVTNGQGLIYSGEYATIFSLKRDKNVRSAFGREALKIIKSFNGLPFTTRWLSKKLGMGKTKFALRELLLNDILDAYPPLPEQGRGLVAQAENTILITKTGCEILTKKD